MSKDSLVSIIMNCHNGEKYLKDSIESILKQTYKNWEVVFYDNCSTDSSKKIFLSYNNKKFKYFYSDNFLTLYQARNSAIEKSKGDYIAFLDTDDLWEKDKLELQMNLFDTPEVGAVFSNAWILKKNTKNKKIHEKKKLPNGYIYNNLIENYNVGLVTIVLKKEYYAKLKKNLMKDFQL